MKKTSLFICLILLLPPSAAAQPLNIVRPDSSTWVCVDFSTDYMRHNPEWKCVSISSNQHFQGVSHVVNYQIEGQNLTIHDEMYKLDYTLYNYTESGQYYHFWPGEPIRYYHYLSPNSP